MGNKEKKGMGKALNIVLRVAAAAVIIFLTYWFALPPVNVTSRSFWLFVIFCIGVIAAATASGEVLKSAAEALKNGRIPAGKRVRGEKSPAAKGSVARKRVLQVCGGAAAAIAVFLVIGSVIGWEVFNAAKYRDLLSLSDGDFASDVAELSMTQIPVVDRDTAVRLGSRKLGEMSDLVSQFDIEEDYTQINYHGKPVRVTPLAYADIIKWAYNQANGLPGYITVDMVTQETTLVRFEGEGMKYSRSDILLRDITRHLRFNYPSAIFDEVSFEINEEGIPYWVASVIKYRVGIWDGKDTVGVVLCNAMTGECEYYDIKDVPQWVDQAYSSDMVVEQLYWHGEYVSGFWNSVFGQRDVLRPTEGYNYVAIDDDVWLYTGMTSALADESNVGFVLVNLRTKEGRFYSVPGAEEYSAMASAEGQVQHLQYISTFPILLNVADRPTYFMSLKDSAGLVKMYAFVDVEQYQTVATGYTVEEARNNYIEKLSALEGVEPPETDSVDFEGTVSAVSSAVVDGDTKYYIILEGDETVYVADISLNRMLPFTAPGDTVKGRAEEDGAVIEITVEKAGGSPQEQN